ncbi:MAG: PIG-L deacetylase family protein [bacterium]|nr:PIG-L deacetylase family protein [bacterium]
MKILVIAPHPDDEVMGCGGTVKRYAKEGSDVFLCIVTKAYTPEWSEDFIKNRKKEIAGANKVLGIKKTFFLDLPTVRLDTLPQKELNEKLTAVIEKVRPEMLFIPHCGDLNNDHRLIFESCLVAARPINNSIKSILAYETLSETEWGLPNIPFVPNAYSDISSTLKKKIEAMRCYGSELRKTPHPRSLEIISALAKKRGSEIGLVAAEAFMLIREIL